MEKCHLSSSGSSDTGINHMEGIKVERRTARKGTGVLFVSSETSRLEAAAKLDMVCSFFLFFLFPL